MEYLELPDGTSYLHLLKNRNTLWEINNEPHLYEVEIVHENEKYLDKNFDDVINMNRVYCNICNIDVPKIYLKQHHESSIHQNLIKLTEDMLERTKKHLKSNNEPINASLNVTETFFCDMCSKIIQNSDRNKHFESKFHKNQVIFEKLLNFFVEAFLRVNVDDAQLDLEDWRNGLDLPEGISKDPSQIEVPLDPAVSKKPSNITNVDPANKIIDPDYLQGLLESVINEPSVKKFNSQPENCKTMEKRNLPTLQTSTMLSKMDPTTSLVPNSEDTKSEPSDNQSNLNTMNPNLNPTNPNFYHTNPMNSNFNPMNPNFNNMNLNYHHMNSMNANWNPENPNFNAMNPNLNPMFPNWNTINPNLNPHFNINKPNLNPMNPNFNPMNPNLNPMNPNVNPMSPNFNPMNPNINPINPNFNPMNPHFNQMYPHFNQMYPHLNPMDSRYKMNPNLNSITPNLNPINSNLHPMDPRHKLGPNLNIMDPQNKFYSNIKPVESQSKLGQNLIIKDPNPKSGPKLIKIDPQSKLSPNLITKEPQFEFGPNLNKTDPQSKLNLNSTDPVPKLDPNLLVANAETKKLIKAINKAERKREKQIKDLQAFEEFSTYIRTIQEKYPNTGFRIEALTVSKIKVLALNGDCVLVTRENFQSHNKKYCRVCQNGNMGIDHEMSEEHISRIMVPVADKNCIREIDDIWSHCVICNELIKFVEDHNQTVSHLANLKKCFIDIPKQKEETDPKNTEELFNKNIVLEDEEDKNIKERHEQESNVPDGEESRNIVDIENTVNAEEKKEKKRVDSQEKKVPFKFDIDKFSNTLADKLLPLFAKYALTKVDATEADSNENNCDGTLKTLKSLVTKVQDNKNAVKQLKDDIQNVVDIYEESVTAEINIFDDEVALNSSSASKNITKYCSVCKIHVTDFESHKTSESHTEINSRAKELRKIITRNNLKEIKDSVDLLKCDICEVNVNYNSKHVDEHVNSEHHRRNYFKFIESNKIILIDQVESQCEPCNKSLLRSNIFDHCKQDKHVKKLKDLINISQTKADPTQKESKSKQSTENKTTVQKDIDVTKILYHFRAQGVEYLCKICHALVSTDAESVKAHVESKHHVDIYNTLLSRNNIFKTAGSFYCGVCEAKIPMTGEITHVYGRNHSDNLILKAKDTLAKKESNGATAPAAVNNPVATSTAAPSTSKVVPISTGKEGTIPLYVKYQFKIISETASTCIICGQRVPNAKVINHALSTTHSFNFNLIMINNTITIKDKMYFCVSCNTSVPIFGEVEHIFGRIHLNNIKQRTLQPIASNGRGILTYDHVLSLTQGKRMVKF